MSARDAESGSSSYKGGSGRAGGLGNGGVGGGRGGGGMGGGAGRNGGIGNQTGLGTGNNIYGNTAFGRSGGMAQGYATRDAASLARAGMGPTLGSYGQFNNLNGSPMFGGSPVQGQSFSGMNAGQAFGQAQAAQAAWQAAQAQPTSAPPGLLGGTPQVSTPLPPADPPPNFSINPAGYNYPGIGYQYDTPQVPGSYPSMWSKNPTSYPQYAGSWSDRANGYANNTYGGSRVTQSMNSTDRGYPSLDSRDTRPAGVW